MIVDDREPAHPGHAALGPGHPTAGCPDYAEFPYNTGQLTVPNKCSGKPGEVTDSEVNARLGNPSTSSG